MAALDAMSRSSEVARDRRVLAVNALRGFARAGYWDPEKIVTSMD